MMKRKLTAGMLALLLCLSLCACGSMRSYTDRTPGMGTDRDSTSGYASERMPTPDPEDGYVEDGTADDGVLDENSAAPSPSITKR